MASSLLSPDTDQDEALNKGQQYYDDRFAQIAKAEEDATFDDIANNDLRSAEESPDSNPMNYTGSGQGSGRGGKAQGLLNFAKKRGGLIGLLAALGLGGGILGTVLGPASMLFNLSENISIRNDSSSTAMERRFLKVFSNMTNPDNDEICKNSTKNIKCRMGRISNSALHTLNKKGVTAKFGTEIYDGKTKKGYPDRNPTSYEFDTGDGNVKEVPARELATFLSAKENRKFASKILGNKGAFNMRTKAWVGKHINEKLYKKFNIGRNGGVADGENGGKKTARERLNESMKKLQDKIPGMETADKISSGVKGRVSKHLGKANKGGAAYLTAVASCIGVRAPGYIASAVAAVQLAQVMPYFMETIGSPASKAKQTAIGSGFTGEDADAAGTILTGKVNGKSALDSQILLSAMGVNKAKAPISKTITPGYSVLTNEGVLLANKAADASEGACNAIMSPAAMYTAMVTDAAVTAATSATLIGGIIKIGVGIAISITVTSLTTYLIGEAAETIIKEVASNDAIPKAEGEELGDVIGVSAMAFFSSGGMARHLPVLSKSDSVAFQNMKEESEQFQKEMDIASLSPFDISSKHTFLGSIVFNTQTAVISNGGLSSGASLLTTLARLPFSLSSQKVSAADYSEAYCGYAKDFSLDTDGSSVDTPCITASGLPGVGLTSSQSAMSTATAIDRAIIEGWIDAEMTGSESATIDELFESKAIKEDTPLREFIETCSNPDDGSYLYAAVGCMAPTGSREKLSAGNVEYDDGEVSDVVKDLRVEGSLDAMTPFLLDYQIVQSINGEDDESGSGNQSQDSGAGQLVGDKAFPLPDGSVQNATTYAGHQGVDLAAPQGTPIFAVAAGTVKRADDVCTARGDRCNGDMGNVVTIDHGNGILTRYLHMLPGTVRVKVGDTVSPGKQLGEVGSTGRSTGDHLHFDVWEDGARIGDVASFEWLKRYNILPSVNKEGLVYHD